MTPGHSIPAGPPRGSPLVRLIATLAIGAGCAGLSLARRRQRLLAGRSSERERLVRQLLDVDSRAQRQLSERLHDEVLQYVLAARMDFDDARDRVPADAQHRIDVALARASASLQATVSELRPIALEHYDLPDALRHTGLTPASDTALTLVVDGDGWPPGARTSADPLLFSTARSCYRISPHSVLVDASSCPPNSPPRRPPCSCVPTRPSEHQS